MSTGEKCSFGNVVYVAIFPTTINRYEAIESPKEVVLVTQADMDQCGNYSSNVLTSTAGSGTVDSVAQKSTK